jgi:hypothetical protein
VSLSVVLITALMRSAGMKSPMAPTDKNRWFPPGSQVGWAGYRVGCDEELAGLGGLHAGHGGKAYDFPAHMFVWIFVDLL